MAEYKKSILFLKDWAILITSLPEKDQLYFWQLFMMYPDAECESISVKPIWNFIKTQLDNFSEKYNKSIVQRNKENGAKGGRPKKEADNQYNTETQNNPKNPMGYLETQKTLNDNVNVNVNVNDNVNGNVNDFCVFKNNISELKNEKTKKEKKVAPKKENIYRSFAHLFITFEEVEKLKLDYDISVIDKILDSIENYKSNTKYKSLYLTTKNWLQKEPKKTANLIHVNS